MAIKTLSYPAHQENNKNGIDQRLSQAHSHDNKDALDAISLSFVDKVDKQLLLTDLSNLPDKGLDNKLLESGVAVTDLIDASTGQRISDNIAYVRRNGSWVKLDDTSVITKVTTSENSGLTIEQKSIIDPSQRLGVTSIYELGLNNDILNELSSIADKMNKIPGAPNSSDDLIIGDNQGEPLKYSGVSLLSLLKREELVKDPNIDDPDKPASSRATYKLQQSIEAISAGISSCKGCVVNAFTAGGNTSSIQQLRIDNPGTGYAIGDIVTLEIPTAIIRPQLMITDVDNAGSILSAEEYKVGVYEDYTTIGGKSASISGGSGKEGKLSVMAMSKPDVSVTTLSSIPNPIPGDTAYVMIDETHDNEPSLYICQNAVIAGNSERPVWVYVVSLGVDNSSITRYES